MLYSLNTLGFLAIFILAIGFCLSRAIRPKPIPGIPYYEPSARRLFGDVPDALEHEKETKEMVTFLTKRCLQLNTPIAQVFVRPFGKPWVVIADAQEASDIMIRRTREFDRSEFFGDIFVEWVPNFHVSMKADDRWREHRKILGDTMSPSFLNTIASPLIYAGALDLVELWREKMRLANGHPFEGADDLHNGIMDAVWAATFGSSCGVNRAQIDLLNITSSINDKVGEDRPVSLPKARHPEEFDAIATITQSCEIPMKSPLPRLHHRLALKLSPKLSAAVARKNKLFSDELDAAWLRSSQRKSSDEEVTCAADIAVRKEVAAAEKQSRAPDYKNDAIRDELHGFLMAGHETTATTLTWSMKFLANDQEIQEDLRRALRATFTRAAEADDVPTAEEIAKSHIPLLEAVIEESLRIGQTSSSIVRTAMVDTEVLGCTIPKGTDLFLLTNGPSYLMPAFEIDNSKRSATSVQSQNKIGSWKGDDIGAFKPERWLVKNEAGEVEFDPKAGPEDTFGAGLRACFGKRLAYLEMRIFLVMIFWNLKLLPLSPDLSTYAARDVLTHVPQFCYLRLAAAN